MEEEDLNQDLNSEVVFVEGIPMSVEKAASLAQSGLAEDIKTPAELSVKTRQESVEDRLGAIGQLQAGVEGAASGLTFGATRLLNTDDPLAAYEELERQKTFAKTAIGGEIVGSILPAFLTGGTSGVATVGRVLSPAALTAAKGAQFVARGGNIVSRLGRTVIAEGAQGALQQVGDYVGMEALKGNEITVDGVVNNAIRGGVIGGIAGGLGYGLGEGASKLSKQLSDVAGLNKAIDDKASRLAGIDTGSGKTKRFDEVVDAKLDDVVDAERQLFSKVDSVRSRNIGKEMDDVLQHPILKATTAGDDGKFYNKLSTGIKRSADELDRARNAAADWAQRYKQALDRVDGDAAAKQLGVPQELDDEGVIQLAKLDEAEQAFNKKLQQVKDQYISPPKPLEPEVPGQSTFSKIKDSVESGLGAYETAQDLGAPLPSVSKIFGDGIIGEGLSWYVKGKTYARALKKAGVLPDTKTVDTASKVKTLRGRIQSKLSSIGEKIIPRKLPQPDPKKIASAARAIAVAAEDQADSISAEDNLSFDSQLAARARDRAGLMANYLVEKAPKNPLQGTPFADKWQPNPYESSDYQRVLFTATDPDEAIEKIIHDPSSWIEVQTLKDLYPDLYLVVTNYLADNAVYLSENLSEAKKQFLGTAFGIPLTITQIPGYNIQNPLVQPQQEDQQVRFARPSNANASPLVENEDPENV